MRGSDVPDIYVGKMSEVEPQESEKEMSWYLVIMDEGIIDSAKTKRSLMVRNGFTKSVREGKSAYLVSADASDGIGQSYYIIKDCNMVINGFETSVNTMSLSKRIDIKKNTNGSIKTCFLYMNSHYFERREAISFNGDGFIGFAGWADVGNKNPRKRAFWQGCDELKKGQDDV